MSSVESVAKPTTNVRMQVTRCTCRSQVERMIAHRARWSWIPQGRHPLDGYFLMRYTRACPRGRREDEVDLGPGVITDVGANAIALAFNAAFTLSNFKFGAIGTSNAAEGVGNTALTTEVEARIAGTQSNPASKQYRCVTVNPCTTARTIQEWGLLDQLAVGGNLYDRRVIGPLTLANGDSVQMTYTTTMASGG